MHKPLQTHWVQKAANNGKSAFPQRVKPSLRRNISWTLAGNVTYAACQWGMLIAIARLGSPETLGQFAFGIALAAPIFMFANMNLRYVQVTDIRDQFMPQDYVSLRLLTCALAFMVAVAAAWFFDLLTVGLVVVGIACTKAFESLSDILHGIQHKHERMAWINVARGIRGVLSLAAVALILAGTGSLVAAIVGLACVNLLVLFAIDLPIARMPAERASGATSLSVHARPGILCRLALVSLPLGLGAALLTFNVHLPRYFIAYYLDAASLGYYAAAAYMIVATDIIVRSARTSALPRLARLYQEHRIKAFCLLTARLMLLGFFTVLPCLLLVWLAGGTILAWIYGPEYAASANVFFWLVVASLIWQSSVPTAALWAMRCYWTDLSVRVGTTLTIVLAAALLVPHYGLLGAAWSMVAGRIAGSIGTTASVLFLLNRSSRAAKALGQSQSRHYELCAVEKPGSFNCQLPATA